MSTFLEKYAADLKAISDAKVQQQKVWMPPDVASGRIAPTPQDDTLAQAYATLRGSMQGGVAAVGTPAGSGGKGGTNPLKSTLNGGKWLLHQAERGLSGIAYAGVVSGQYKKAHPGTTDTGIFSANEWRREGSAFLKGFKSKDHQYTFADSLRANGVEGKKTSAALGFGLDLFADPLNLLPVGAVIKGARVLKNANKGVKTGAAAAEDILKKPVDHLAETVLNSPTPVKAEEKTAQAFVAQLLKKTRIKPEGSRVFDVSPGGVASERAAPKALGAAVEAAPALPVPPPVPKPVISEAVVKATTPSKDELKLITHNAKMESIYKQLGEVPTYVKSEAKAAAPAVAKAVTRAKAKGLDPAVARLHAMYQHILSHPKTIVPVVVSGKSMSLSVGKLLETAAKKPEQAKYIDDFIQQHAKTLAGKPADFFSEPPRINIHGRETSNAAKITVDDFAKMLTDGQVPGNASADFYGLGDAAQSAKAASVLEKFAVADPQDLGALHVSHLTQGKVQLGHYLQQLGVHTRNVKLAALDPNSLEGLSAAAPVIQKVAAKITEMAGPKGFDSVDSLVAGLASGSVKHEDLTALLKMTGAKSVAELKPAIDKILKQGETISTRISKARANTVDNALWDSAPVGATELPVTPIIETVKPAEQILKEIIKDGDVTSLQKTIETLDDAQVEGLNAALSYAVRREIIDPLLIEKYPYLTKTGARRTSNKAKAGLGHYNDWNKWSQYTVINGLVAGGKGLEKIRKAVPKGAKGALGLRSIAVQEHVMPIVRSVDKLLRENGIPPTLGTDRRYTLSIVDVMDSMPQEFVAKHMFSVVPGADHIPPTFWSDIGEIMMDHAHGHISLQDARQGIGHILTTPQKQHSGKEIISGVKRQMDRMAKSDVQSSHDYISRLTDAFMGGTKNLAAALERNAAELTAANIDGAQQISDETLKAFSQLVSKADFGPSELLRLANERDTFAKTIANQLGVVSPQAKSIAASDILVKSAEMLPPEVIAEAHSATKVSKAATPATKADALVAHGAENDINAQSLMQDDPVMLKDIGQKYEKSLMYGILKAFAPHLSNATIRPFFLDNSSKAQTVARTWHNMFATIQKTHAKDDITAAWQELQRGTTSQVPSVAAAQAELQKATKTLFSDDTGTNFFARHGIEAGDVNRLMKRYGIHDQFALDGDKGLADGWKQWQTEDPLDLLSRFQAAAQTAKMEKDIGMDLSRNFGSKIKTPGSVRISAEGSVLGRHLHPEYYFPKDIADQMHVLDKAMRELETPQNIGKIGRLYDSVLHSYKSGLTIYRPGHHVRNMVGDVWLSYMAGVSNPKVYGKALQVMGANGKGRYADFDAFKALSEGGKANAKGTALAKSDTKIITTTINGKRVDLTTGDIYGMAYNRGLLPDYRTLEDIGGGVDKELSVKFHLPGRFSGKAHNAAATLSESRDHYVRLAHFIDVLEKGKFKSLEEASHSATQVVRKWHPDGSDLTHFESKVARRGFLFYSWIRKALPLVIEGTVMSPGKSVMIPKAMLNLAKANGIDPESLSDPFPPDQLFPSWIRDDLLGPQFGNADQGYWGINPGVPNIDVGNDYFKDPRTALHTVLGSMVPPAKQLMEINSGDATKGIYAKDLRTGIPIKDKSDYWDAQIPGVNSIAGLTKKSPTSLFTQDRGVGNGQTPEQTALAQSKIDRSGGVDLTALFNYITGTSLRNNSKPSYITQAQREQAGR